MPQSYMCNGNITPNTFVKLDATTPANYKVIQCVANSDLPFGVSQDGSYYPPGLLNNPATLYAGIAGSEMLVYIANDICLLAVGTAGWTVGDSLMAETTTGWGVTQSSTNPTGAIGLATQVAGDLGRVRVTGPQLNG